MGFAGFGFLGKVELSAGCVEFSLAVDVFDGALVLVDGYPPLAALAGLLADVCLVLEKPLCPTRTPVSAFVFIHG